MDGLSTQSKTMDDWPANRKGEWFSSEIEVSQRCTRSACNTDLCRNLDAHLIERWGQTKPNLGWLRQYQDPELRDVLHRRLQEAGVVRLDPMRCLRKSLGPFRHEYHEIGPMLLDERGRR
jgi:hypothetical protein